MWTCNITAKTKPLVNVPYSSSYYDTLAGHRLCVKPKQMNKLDSGPECRCAYILVEQMYYNSATSRPIIVMLHSNANIYRLRVAYVSLVKKT